MSHGRIFQIEAKPLRDRLSSYDIPQWFTESVADYVSDECDDDKYEYEKLITALRGAAILREGHKLVFTADCKQYFRDKYKRFNVALENLRNTTFYDFTKSTGPGYRLTENLYRLNEEYEEKFGIYVYTNDDLIPLDRFLRYVNEGDVYYLGGVVDFRY